VPRRVASATPTPASTAKAADERPPAICSGSVDAAVGRRVGSTWTATMPSTARPAGRVDPGEAAPRAPSAGGGGERRHAASLAGHRRRRPVTRPGDQTRVRGSDHLGMPHRVDAPLSLAAAVVALLAVLVDPRAARPGRGRCC
jgi:hypothetical protein